MLQSRNWVGPMPLLEYLGLTAREVEIRHSSLFASSQPVLSLREYAAGAFSCSISVHQLPFSILCLDNASCARPVP